MSNVPPKDRPHHVGFWVSLEERDHLYSMAELAGCSSASNFIRLCLGFREVPNQTRSGIARATMLENAAKRRQVLLDYLSEPRSIADVAAFLRCSKESAWSRLNVLVQHELAVRIGQRPGVTFRRIENGDRGNETA